MKLWIGQNPRFQRNRNGVLDVGTMLILHNQSPTRCDVPAPFFPQFEQPTCIKIMVLIIMTVVSSHFLQEPSDNYTLLRHKTMSRWESHRKSRSWPEKDPHCHKKGLSTKPYTWEEDGQLKLPRLDLPIGSTY